MANGRTGGRSGSTRSGGRGASTGARGRTPGRESGERRGSQRGRGGDGDAPANHRQPWSSREVETLKQLVVENTPTRVMGIKLARTPESIYAKASALGVSLKPNNQRSRT